ncbi:MAG: pitrilysin family protein [Gammaproteobacteria bacterium]
MLNKFAFIFLGLFSFSALAAPQIQHWQTSRGIPVYFVETTQLPMLDLQIIFDAGSARDPDDKRGLSQLTNNLLSLAAGGRTAYEINFDFERLGAEFGSHAGYDSASVSLRSLSDESKLQPALENLRTVLSSPDFRPEDLERQRNRMLVGIQRKQQSPGTIAQERFEQAIYGEHPYAYPNEGTADSLSRIGRDDLADFHEEYYTASNAMVTLVGDIDRDRAEVIAEEVTARLATGQKPEAVPAVTMPDAAELIRINHPSSQVHILMGQPGMRYGDPDYFPLFVGNHILGGGGLVSRLFDEVREKRGLSYSASSYFAPRRDAGPFLARIQTRADQVEEGVRVMRQTIDDLVREGPTDEELIAAKKNLTGGFPLRIDSNGKISGYLGVIGFYGLPLDYLDRFIERVEAVTVAEIRDAFQRRIDVDRFITVLVGPVGQDNNGN